MSETGSVNDDGDRPKRQPARRLSFALRLLGPAILLFVLTRLPDPSAVGRAIWNADPLLLFASAAINLIGVHVKVVRWQVFLRVRGFTYATKPAWLAFASSMYLSMLTPGRVGDVLRIQYLRHEADVPYTEGLATIVIDRLCDLYVLGGFVAIAIGHYGPVLDSRLRQVSWVVVAITVLAPLGLLIPGIAEKLLGAIYRKLSRDSLGTGLTTFLTALRAQVGRALLITLPLTVVAFLVNFFQAWLVARALSLDLGYFDVMCLTAVASLLGLLPISISGMGVREALFATVFPSLGYSKEQAVSYGLLVFAVIYLSAAAIGFVTWQLRPPPTGRDVTPT